jgi:hypothetical protein
VETSNDLVLVLSFSYAFCWGDRVLTLLRTGNWQLGTDDPELLFLPSHLFSQTCDVGYVMAAVPGIQRQVFLERHWA